jgi:hypothetical protein
MVTFFKFYWLCVKDAWGGSIGKANAWATILGAIIIWAALLAWEYQLMLPDTLGYGIVLVVVCLFAAWVVIFIGRFVNAPPRLYATLERELESLKGTRKPELRVTRFYPQKDIYTCFWYVDIQNIGRTAATGLRFQLEGIENGPKDQSWKALYPYDVRPEKIKHLQDWSAVSLTIDRDERVPFELFETRCSSDQQFRIVGLDSRKINHLNDTAIEIDPEEKWLLTYNVGANEAELLTFHVHIYFKDGAPFAEKVEDVSIL